MITPGSDATIGEVFVRCVRAFGDQPFLAVPIQPTRAYHPQGWVVSYRAAGEAVGALKARYQAAGYGVGHRVGLLLENRPEHLLHKLAMNALGVCCVPLNADHRAREMAYVLDHARIDLVVAATPLLPALRAALALARGRPAVVEVDDTAPWPSSRQRAAAFEPDAATPASVLYTSGTTGHPKGCVLSHRYELESGRWYASLGGLARFQEGGDRLYNPLPLFHVNASILSFYCVMLMGNCQIQPERFSPTRWWPEIRQTGATVAHYLGVVVPMLLAQPPGDADPAHGLRFALGAGVDPRHHERFEARFGLPLVEIWGMTEMVRLIGDTEPSRQVGTRAFGIARAGIDVRVVDAFDRDLPDGEPGEMLIRHSQARPRQDFFSGYLDDPEATEHAWRGGWFHTGDVVTRDPDGRLHFVDRRKHIIRRSGENISAAEVEAVLQAHPLVRQAAVLAVPDAVREEEVLACLVLAPQGQADVPAAVGVLLEHCRVELAYYKVPGWIWVTEALPTTSTQKIQKHQILAAKTPVTSLPGVVDVRLLKRRG